MKRVIFALALVACQASPDTDMLTQRVRKAGEACKSALSVGQYDDARAAAREALDLPKTAALRDESVNHLRFCYTLANTLYQVNASSTHIQNIIVSLSNLSGGQAAPYRPMRNIVADAIRSLLVPIEITLEENQKQIEMILQSNDFLWEIKQLPVKVGDIEIMQAGGHYDRGELLLLKGMGATLLGTLYMIESMNLEFDLAAFQAYASLADTPLDQIEARPLVAVMNASAVALSTSDNFLALDPANGKALVQKAGQTFAGGFDAILEASRAMAARKGDQRNHLVEYKKEGAQEYFVFHITFEQNPTNATLVDFKKFSGVSIPLREDVGTSMARIRDSFLGKPGVRASLQNDVFPVVALLAVVMLESGAIDAVIDQALKNISPQTAVQVKAWLDSAEKYDDFLFGALVSLVPVPVELDFGYAFQNPVSLRSIVLGWYQPDPDPNAPSAMAPFTQATFVLSYECEGGENPLKKSPESFFCERAIDAEHFSNLGEQPWKNNPLTNNFGANWPGRIAKDGYAYRSPYFGFKDPTFGKLLYLDISPLAKEGYLSLPPPGSPMPLADQMTLNTTIGEMFRVITALFAL